MSYYKYKKDLLNRFKAYRIRHFTHQDDLFIERYNHVFKSKYAKYNLSNSDLDELLPRGRRHRWFGSMGSSQALAVSVFGIIKKRDNLWLLTEVIDDNGYPLLPGFIPDGEPEFDYKVPTLNEPSQTQVDFFMPGRNGNVAIECKLWEPRLGTCSQVSKKKCNGNYAEQSGRKHGERCYLTEKGITYWDYIPGLFKWRADKDHTTCPIWKPYQLVRNVLAASIDPNTGEVWGQPTAVLIYDARNPVFAPGGKADELFREVNEALDGPASLKRTTWQSIAAVLLEHEGYDRLLTWLDDKYGIR